MVVVAAAALVIFVKSLYIGTVLLKFSVNDVMIESRVSL